MTVKNGPRTKNELERSIVGRFLRRGLNTKRNKPRSKSNVTCLRASMASNSELCSLQNLSAIRAADDEFGEGTFLDWAKHNKRSWKHDRFRLLPLLRTFAGKTLGEITPAAIETFKSIRLHSVTRRKTKRSPASVKHEMNVLSRIFSLAVTWGLADSNPCGRVSRINATGICYPKRNHGC